MSLRAEVATLREEARALRSLLERLEQRIQDLEDSAEFDVVDTSPPAHTQPSPVRVERSSRPSLPALQPRPSLQTAPALRIPALLLQSSEFVLPGRWAGSLVAHWLERPRGSSGRDSLRLASKLFFVCRDSQGSVPAVLIVTSSFARVRALCFSGAPRTVSAQSVFVGLPSHAEVRLALAAAGLPCPELSGHAGSQ